MNGNNFLLPIKKQIFSLQLPWHNHGLLLRPNPWLSCVSEFYTLQTWHLLDPGSADLCSIPTETCRLLICNFRKLTQFSLLQLSALCKTNVWGSGNKTDPAFSQMFLADTSTILSIQVKSPLSHMPRSFCLLYFASSWKFFHCLIILLFLVVEREHLAEKDYRKQDLITKCSQTVFGY